MSYKYTYYAITDYEWLEPTGDASLLVIRYAITDDIDRLLNLEDKYITVKLSRSAEVLASLDNPSDKVIATIGYFKIKLESTLKNRGDMPNELLITSCDEDFPPNIDSIDFNFDDWNRVEVDRGFGFA